MAQVLMYLLFDMAGLGDQEPILLTWINFNPTMEMSSHAQ